MESAGEPGIISVDGNHLEGGGQILRLAAALSGLLKKPVEVFDIRGGRPKPGLMAQHLTGLQLSSLICNGTLSGASLGSTQVVLTPGPVMTAGVYDMDTGTAGSGANMEEETSIGLLIQVSLPLLLFASPPGSKSRMTLGGGTNAAFAPQIDYMTHVFAPVAKKFGVNFDIRVERRGYYPRGGGLVSVEVPSIPVLKCVNLTDMGSVLRIRGMSFVAGALPLKAAHEIADYATRALRRHFPPDVPIDIHRYKEAPRFAVGTGSGITLYAETSTGMTFGGSCLGDRSKRNNVIGEEAAEELTEAFLAKACLDKWAQDQVILFMALARGKSVIRSTSLTLHTKTAIFVAEKFTGMGLLPSSVEVSIEILLDRIDCPGLRLPHKEMTYMRIYLFDVDVRTGQAPPYLPIIFQEQFKFSKKFYAMKDWTELEVMLRFQALNVELLQRQIGGYSKILA
ncbi:unnamed protein product [Notodromas monacha]|uniref:RNA 3'-terminal phosphate cyclase n=1 Tax=Notodromas monacha TaxID=399045 RepID=A0A7R9BMY4_9CRUS|nr:unnamed protein product [Notodromas monacha]CAG0918479.1 unnamed protein product [Notodromas monacha]